MSSKEEETEIIGRGFFKREGIVTQYAPWVFDLMESFDDDCSDISSVTDSSLADASQSSQPVKLEEGQTSWREGEARGDCEKWALEALGLAIEIDGHRIGERLEGNRYHMTDPTGNSQAQCDLQDTNVKKLKQQMHRVHNLPG